MQQQQFEIALDSGPSVQQPEISRAKKKEREGGAVSTSVTWAEIPPQHRLSVEPAETRRQSSIYTSLDSRMVHNTTSDVIVYLLTALSYCIMVATFPLSMFVCLKVIKEYERAVIFRLGRLVAGDTRGPGLIWVLPCIDSYRKVDLRVVSFDVPPQEILSSDSVTVSVDAVVYFRINNPIISVTNVSDAYYSTKLLAQTTLRNVMGLKTLHEMLSERDYISQTIENLLYEATLDWGVKVERLEIKDLRLPDQLMRVMAAEAEASREARARVIQAEGEHKSSRALKEAADTITECPEAMQLRYLQTISTIAAEHSSTIVFPVPIDYGWVNMAAWSGHLQQQERKLQKQQQTAATTV